MRRAEGHARDNGKRPRRDARPGRDPADERSPEEQLFPEGDHREGNPEQQHPVPDVLGGQELPVPFLSDVIEGLRPHAHSLVHHIDADPE